VFKSRDPQRGAKLPHWEYLVLDRGAKIRGWLAGPLVGVEVHHVGVSKPCLQLLTEGALPCPWHADGIRLQWLGYVPVYSEFGSQVVVGVKADSKEAVDALPLHTTVRITRAKAYHSPILITPDPWTETRPTRPDRLPPADIRPWLLRLWKCPELTAFYEAQAAAGKVEQARPIKPPAAKPVTDSHLWDEPKRSQIRDMLRRNRKKVEAENTPEHTSEANGKPKGDGEG